MRYSLTVFDHPRWWDKQQRFIYDNKTHRRIDIDGWDKFVRFFYKMAERPLDSKQDAELISPAVFHQPSTRKNEFVIEWANWCCVDVDDYIPEGKPVRVVSMAGYGCPCGGTHVDNLRELGKVEVTKIKSKKGNTRVSYKLA